MTTLLAFIGGILVGSFATVLVMSLCVIAGKSDDEMERCADDQASTSGTPFTNKGRRYDD
jgi:hypothetical protein